MNNLNINLKIAKDTSELKLNDMTGNLTIEAALRKAKMDFEKGLNRVIGLVEIIKAIEGDEIETQIHAVRDELRDSRRQRT